MCVTWMTRRRQKKRVKAIDNKDANSQQGTTQGLTANCGVCGAQSKVARCGRNTLHQAGYDAVRPRRLPQIFCGRRGRDNYSQNDAPPLLTARARDKLPRPVPLGSPSTGRRHEAGVTSATGPTGHRSANRRAVVTMTRSHGAVRN